MLRCENLSKAFGDKAALRQASLHIAPGEIVGLVGPSGSGKSTLARLLCGILKPDSGEIYLHDRKLADPAMDYDRPAGLAIQMVYQQPYLSLDPNRKLGRQMQEIIRYQGFAPDRGAEKDLIRASLREVGLGENILRHRPGQISGGEAQRFTLALCLLYDPRVLVMDEATSMLDVSTAANVIALVRETMLPRGGSVLFISHDRAVTEHICHRIYRLKDGCLEEIP